MKNKLELTALDPISNKSIAQVILNGYSIDAGGPLGASGPMRSFVIVKGCLHDYWASRMPVLLKHHSGIQAYVRVAALPVEEGEMGFFEALELPDLDQALGG